MSILSALQLFNPLPKPKLGQIENWKMTKKIWDDEPIKTILDHLIDNKKPKITMFYWKKLEPNNAKIK